MIKEYINGIINGIGEFHEEEQIQGIVNEVKEKYNTQCDYFYAGGFDSPGYDIDCYVIAFLDEDGLLQGRSVNIERY